MRYKLKARDHGDMSDDLIVLSPSDIRTLCKRLKEAESAERKEGIFLGFVLAIERVDK